MEILSPDAALPVLYARRLDPTPPPPEQTRYIARPGLRALPSGSGMFGAVVMLQVFALIILLWTIWWPQPISRTDYEFSIGCTAMIFTLIAVGCGLLLRKYPGFLLAVLRSPFISISVTDRRLLWTLPWMRTPLMEIGRERVIGGILGVLDRKGNGAAAVMLVPGDPSADIDGNIHFDRLPNARAFIDALGGW